MATINNKFHYYSSLALFEAAKENIPTSSIAFVDQPEVKGDGGQVTIAAQRFIYTHAKKWETNFDPATIQTAISALGGRLDTLEGEGDGSVKKAVKTLSDTLMGLLGNGFDTTNTVTKKVADLAAAVDGMDLAEVKGEGQAIVSISQADGKVSATAGDVAAAHVTVADAGDLWEGTTVEAVLAEIDAAAKALVAGLNVTDTPVAKSVVTGVSETAGKVTVTRKALTSGDKTLKITQADATDDINLEVNVDGTTILKDANTGVLSVANSALVQYVGDNKTVSVSEPSQGAKTISSLIKIAEVTTGLAADVEKAWDLVDADGTPITGSSRIIVKKDQAFVTGKLGHVDDTINENTGAITDGTGAASIDLVYKNDQGKYILITINIEEYLKEAEFKDGFKVTNHEVSVKLSTNTESAKYLKIQAIEGENGAIELSGIDAAIAAASTKIAEKATGHVTVSKSEDATAGTTYTIAENDIASDAALTAEVTRAKSAETAIDGAIGLTKGESDETRTYTNAGTFIGKGETNTVASDIKALDTKLAGVDSAIAGAKTTIAEKSTGHVTVTKQAGTGNTPDSYTIAENDIASAALVGTLPSTGITSTTVVDYAAEVAKKEAGTAETNAKTYADGITVNGQEQEDQEITLGSADINVSTGYAKASTSADIAAGDSLSTALGKLEKKADAAASTSPFEYATGHESTKSTVLKGENLTAQNEGELAIGHHNNSVTGSTDASKTVFSIGNGSQGALSNAFEVRADGTIYIKYGSTTVSLQELISNEIDWYEGE